MHVSSEAAARQRRNQLWLPFGRDFCLKTQAKFQFRETGVVAVSRFLASKVAYIIDVLRVARSASSRQNGISPSLKANFVPRQGLSVFETILTRSRCLRISAPFSEARPRRPSARRRLRRKKIPKRNEAVGILGIFYRSKCYINFVQKAVKLSTIVMMMSLHQRTIPEIFQSILVTKYQQV